MPQNDRMEGQIDALNHRYLLDLRLLLTYDALAALRELLTVV